MISVGYIFFDSKTERYFVYVGFKDNVFEKREFNNTNVEEIVSLSIGRNLPTIVITNFEDDCLLSNWVKVKGKLLTNFKIKTYSVSQFGLSTDLASEYIIALFSYAFLTYPNNEYLAINPPLILKDYPKKLENWNTKSVSRNQGLIEYFEQPIIKNLNVFDLLLYYQARKIILPISKEYTMRTQVLHKYLKSEESKNVRTVNMAVIIELDAKLFNKIYAADEYIKRQFRLALVRNSKSFFITQSLFNRIIFKLGIKFFETVKKNKLTIYVFENTTEEKILFPDLFDAYKIMSKVEHCRLFYFLSKLESMKSSYRIEYRFIDEFIRHFCIDKAPFSIMTNLTKTVENKFSSRIQNTLNQESLLEDERDITITKNKDNLSDLNSLNDVDTNFIVDEILADEYTSELYEDPIRESFDDEYDEDDMNIMV